MKLGRRACLLELPHTTACSEQLESQLVRTIGKELVLNNANAIHSYLIYIIAEIFDEGIKAEEIFVAE